MEKENIIIQYIAIWGWHIIAIIFLVSSLILISLSMELMPLIFFFAFLIGFLICEIISYGRKSKLENIEDE